jgi:hypothetical protein
MKRIFLTGINVLYKHIPKIYKKPPVSGNLGADVVKDVVIDKHTHFKLLFEKLYTVKDKLIKEIGLLNTIKILTKLRTTIKDSIKYNFDIKKIADTIRTFNIDINSKIAILDIVKNIKDCLNYPKELKFLYNIFLFLSLFLSIFKFISFLFSTGRVFLIPIRFVIVSILYMFGVL